MNGDWVTRALVAIMILAFVLPLAILVAGSFGYTWTPESWTHR